MSFKKAVIIGKSGQVSSALKNVLEGREVLFTSSSGSSDSISLDLAEPSSIKSAFKEIGGFMGSGGGEVFLSGAMTNVDLCERDQERCRLVNWIGPRIVAEESFSRGFGFTYFSSEYVFGGAEFEGGPVGPFSEESIPYPTSWYGRCKWEAEKEIQKIYGNRGALVARTTMVYSWDPSGMNFLMQYVRQLEKSRLGAATPFRIPNDQISTPTYAESLAKAVLFLRDRGLGGVFHLAGPDLLSRAELVRRVGAFWGFSEAEVKNAFQIVNTSDLGQAAKRPLTAGLSAGKIESLGFNLDSLEVAFQKIFRLREKAGR